MDMNTPISPLILHEFYRILIVEFLIISAVIFCLWFFFRRSTGFYSLTTTLPEQSFEGENNTAFNRIRRGLAFSFGSIWILDGLLQMQPQMSNQFISGLEAPLVSGLPAFLPRVLSPLLYMWSLHPLTYDSLAAWIQILIGVTLLFGPQRRLGRFALYVSIAWACVIWVVGEGFGIFGGATWLTGAPGAVLLYGVAAVAMLQPPRIWEKGITTKIISVSVGSMWIVDAILQSLPSSGFWQQGGLQGAELSMAEMSQPAWMATPLFLAAKTFNREPAVWNSVFVITLLGFGILWLVRPKIRGLGLSTVIFTALTWWIGQDFGVIGGMGTDLNTGGPLLVLLLSVISLQRVNTKVISERYSTSRRTLVRSRVYLSIGTAVGLMLISSTIAAAAAQNGTSSEIQGALSNSALTPVNQMLPNLKLTDQYGNTVSLSSFRGKAVLLTFLDPVCYDDCPLIAQEMKQADKLLGPYADKVQMVAIVANPLFHSVKDVQKFDDQEGFTGIDNWSFLTSDNLAVLKNAWHKLYEYVSVPSMGMVNHAENMYFVSPDGEELWLAQANGSVSGSGSYSDFMAAYAEKMLGISAEVKTISDVHPKSYTSGLSHPNGFDTIQMDSQSDGWATAFVSPYQEVLRTINGGRTWENITPPGISPRGGILVAARSNSQAWALVPQYQYFSNSALFHTLDGGTHWSQIGVAGPIPKMYGSNALSVSPDGTLWITGTSNRTDRLYLYKSTNQAQTWTAVNLPLSLAGHQTWTTEAMNWTSVKDGDLLVKGGHGVRSQPYLLKTTDGGETWISTRLPSSIASFNGMYSIGTQTQSLMASGLFTSSESGIRYLDAVSKNLLFAITMNKSHTQIVQSTNGGKTWAPVFTDSELAVNSTSSS